MNLRPDRRLVLLAGLGASACATAPAATPALSGFARPRLAPIRMEMQRITRITVCTRPFRPAGPRLDVENVAGKRVVHNYGHGGSGWSLAWGSAEIVAQKALDGGAKDIAVIGCGALGLTAALTLQRAGAKVTIYAKERTPDTRSARASGTWSPDSRIADADKVDAQFPALWERMTRKTYGEWQHYLGMPGEPVAWTDRYNLYDTPRIVAAIPRPERARDPGEIHFAEYSARVRDLSPPFRELEAHEHPFPVPRVRQGTVMMFNVAELAHMLTRDFLTEGGRIVQTEFHTPADLARLSEPVVVNCTGYGARALWKDETLTPVRGQIAWLAPQPEARYGVRYRGISVISRPDGIVVQQTGTSDMWGVGVADETPDRAETEDAVRTMATVFARART
ncbi:MAG: FAD-dependent oxidoreductase [Hyphomonadaceae bacterium]|nr:FAD-dependent oxidoreductase [Hyphomonadaceae bacterium]